MIATKKEPVSRPPFYHMLFTGLPSTKYDIESADIKVVQCWIPDIKFVVCSLIHRERGGYYDIYTVNEYAITIKADRAAGNSGERHLDSTGGVGLGELLGVHFSVLRVW